MDSMIIQIGPKSGQLANIIKCNDLIFNIGRSFKNDLVLSDPFLAPNQLRLRKSQNDWYIDVLDNTNPVFVNGKLLKQSQVKINPGDWLTVGRTILRFFSDDYQIESARKLFFSNFYHLNVWKLIIPILLIILSVSGFSIFSEWLTNDSEINWQEMLSSVLVVQCIILIWSFTWAIVGKILRHQNQFLIQFTVTSVVFLLAGIVELIFSPIAYITNSKMTGLVLEWGLAFLSLSFLLYLNYSIATNLRKPLRSACLVSGLILGLLYTVYNLDQDSFDKQADYMNALQPPMMKLHGDLNTDEYLASQEELFELVEIKMPKTEE